MDKVHCCYFDGGNPQVIIEARYYKTTCPKGLLAMYEKSRSKVCMVSIYSKSEDRPGKTTNPSRGQLNRENKYFPVSVSALEFGLARRVRQSGPASACPSHI